MSQDTPCIAPYLYYQDGIAAIDFLCRAFGFDERARHCREDGSLLHGEVGIPGGLVMLGTPVDSDGKPRPVANAPVRHAGVMVIVDDVDAHHARAKAAGAPIVTAPFSRPDGQRAYSATDPEGQQWHFGSGDA